MHICLLRQSLRAHLLAVKVVNILTAINIEKLHRRERLDLVVIDTLATLLPGYAET